MRLIKEWIDYCVNAVSIPLSKFIMLEKINHHAIRKGDKVIAPGIDADINNPKKYYRELFADWRYLANSGYPRIKQGKEWGGWNQKGLEIYTALIVDALRSVYFPVIPPDKTDPKYKTSYWELYRKAEKHMKTKPPHPDKVKEWDSKRKQILEKR